MSRVICEQPMRYSKEELVRRKIVVKWDWRIRGARSKSCNCSFKVEAQGQDRCH